MNLQLQLYYPYFTSLKASFLHYLDLDGFPGNHDTVHLIPPICN